ncbi:PH domain-containing protein [Jiella sp. MQZ9-1]|uniref:PH domain-containing protein n=1 Tax=Jiella flava TaxID=2816857 RepID=A0A939JWA7_9HYPH|nr:photosynthetic complex putative assembly protein PuhB [Jiella flava]MBO0663319.1 PH domain-containing protein [Jiella flava]MCD2471895.1 PH domain-containing protein [Jiella flava]
MSTELEEFDDIKTVVTEAELPKGERILWQVRPDWWRLALGAFRLKLVGLYFMIFALWKIGVTHHETGSWAQGVGDAATLLPALGVGVAMIMLYAYITARATSFTLTSRRLVMRFGIALPAQLNIPLGEIDHAALKLHADGTGDLPLKVGKIGRPSYFQLWPYARPWRLGAAEPMLRAVPDAAEAARTIAKALVAHQGGTRSVVAGNAGQSAPKSATGFAGAHPAAV